MKRLIWTLRRWGHTCPWSGKVGLLLCILAAGVMVASIHPQIAARTAQLHALQTKMVALRTEAAAAARNDATPMLPGASTYTAFLRTHAGLALDRSIELTEIDYASRPEADHRLIRHTLRYTIDGTYPVLRDYLANLESMPGVRVETLSFVRSPNPDGTVNALVQLSYLVEAGG